MSCACGAEWRIEACDLRTGRVRAIVHPLSFDFQSSLNTTAPGNMILPTRDVSVRDIWPHLTSIYISRIAGGSATPDNPYVEWGGMIEKFSADDNGATSVGMISIDGYLHKRNIGMNGSTSLVFPQRFQTEIGAVLVQAAAANGIPLTALAAASTRRRDRTYKGYERKNIGEAIEELTNVIEGVDYELTHTREDGAWSTQVVFRDYVGTNRDVILQSDREAAGYGLDVDAQNHATYVDALGAGEEADQLTAHAEDEENIYPRFDAVPSWQDVSLPPTLLSHARGYVEENREPVAVPSAVVRGMDPDPALIRNGDTIEARINYGAVTYNGPARVVSTSWAVGTDGPASRTYELIPLTRASQSVLNQPVPSDDCAVC